MTCDCFLCSLKVDGKYYPVFTSSQPCKCPVCEGKGIVPGGFYASTGPYNVSTAATEQCRACDGKGVIWKT